MRQDQVLLGSAADRQAPAPGLSGKTSTGDGQSQPKAGDYVLFGALARLDRRQHLKRSKIRKPSSLQAATAD